MRSYPSPTKAYSYQEFAAFAEDLIDQAATIAVKDCGHSREQIKQDGTLVTQTDQELDQMICKQIQAVYPTHAILSEEQNTIYDDTEYTWVIDPIDGTTNYARGLPMWGVSIALLHCGTPVVGILTFPLLHEKYSAIKNLGTTRNGLSIHTDNASVLDTRHLVFCCSRTARRFIVETPMKSRILGSTTYHLCKVADGTALASVEMTPKVWDIAASMLILSEAGGMAVTIDDTPLFPLATKRTDLAAVSMPLLAAANQSVYQLMKGYIRPLEKPNSYLQTNTLG